MYEQVLPFDNVAVRGSGAGSQHNAASQKTSILRILVATFRYCVPLFLNYHCITRYIERIKRYEICTEKLLKEVGSGGVINGLMSGSDGVYHPVQFIN
jgi:hypothetical protein